METAASAIGLFTLGVALPEAFDLTGRVHQLLLPGVERVSNSFPQAQRTCAAWYSGWISGFIAGRSLTHRLVPNKLRGLSPCGRAQSGCGAGSEGPAGGLVGLRMMKVWLWGNTRKSSIPVILARSTATLPSSGPGITAE